MSDNELKLKNTKKSLNQFIDVPVVEGLQTEELKSKADAKGRFYATGRRKESVAKLWLSFGKGIEVNKVSLEDFFKESEESVFIAKSPFAIAGLIEMKIVAKVLGGGKRSQAYAIKLALSRAICLFDENLRDVLKKSGCLTVDSRRHEREHYGFRRSRVRQQYCR